MCKPVGSNSLTELLVFGNRAGKNAAEYAMTQNGVSKALAAQAADEALRIDQQFLNKKGGHEKIAGLRKEMHTTMEEGAGIYRTEVSLKQSQQKIRELQDRFKNIVIEDNSRLSILN
jgi:fumarate reductase flavoprotein subunit